jgi:hypothetical protein
MCCTKEAFRITSMYLKQEGSDQLGSNSALVDSLEEFTHTPQALFGRR